MSQGIVSIPSTADVDTTVSRIESILRENGVKVFAVIDHSGEAAAAGLSMLPTKVVIFGNPKAGTPLMIARPSTAIDLPLKLLVAEDADGKTTISWNDPEWLLARHGLAEELKPNIAVIAAIAAAAAQ